MTIPAGLLGPTRLVTPEGLAPGQTSGLLQAFLQDPTTPINRFAQNLNAVGQASQGPPGGARPGLPPSPGLPAIPGQQTFRGSRGIPGDVGGPPGGGDPVLDGGFSPANLGALAGGVAAVRAAGPGGTLAQALAEGVASGASTFIAARNRQEDVKAARERQAEFARRVQALGLNPEAEAGLLSMPADEGAKLLANLGIDLAKEDAKPFTLSEGQARFSGRGQVIAAIPKPEEEFDTTSLPSDVREAFAVALRRDPRDPDSFGAPLSPEDAQRAKDYIQAKANSGRTSVSVTTGAGEGAAQKQLWDTSVSQLTAEHDRVRTIPRRMALYKEILASTEKPYFSGSAADLRTKAAAFGAMLGLPVDTGKIADTQTLVSALREAAISRIKELDGRPTDKDMEILLQAMGTENLQPEALQNIIQRAMRIADEELTLYEEGIQAFERDFEGTPFKVPSYLKRNLRRDAVNAGRPSFSSGSRVDDKDRVSSRFGAGIPGWEP